MMKNTLFEGQLVRLVPIEPERDSRNISTWSKDSDYSRLLDISPAVMYNPKLVQNWYEKGEQHEHVFMIQTLEDDRMIGFINLGGIELGRRNRLGWESESEIQATAERDTAQMQ